MSENITQREANAIDQSDAHTGVDRACPECGTAALQRTSNGAEIVCGDCGLVVEKPKTFSKTEQLHIGVSERHQSRVGPRLTPRFHDRGLTTTIDWRNVDGYGNTLPPGKRRRMDRLRKWQQRCRVTGNEDRNLRFALGEIDRIASEVELPVFVRETASTTYRRAFSVGLVGRYATETVAASTLYIACRVNDVPRPMAEIATASRAEKRDIGRAYRLVSRELDINLEPIDPRQYLPRLCSALECAEQVRTQAANIIEITAKRGGFAGKTPMGVTAAAVYLASLRCNEKKTQRDIAKAAGISVPTLRSRYHEQLEMTNSGAETVCL